MKKLGFTLAEVLITLTVIGVVAAMVLPNLAKHYQNKTLETQTRHFYSMMSLAIDKYMADHHVDNLSDTPMYCEAYEGWNCRLDYNSRGHKEVQKFIMNYLKVALVCGNSEDIFDTTNTCYNITAKVIDKNSDTNNPWGPRYILTHGYAIRMNPPNSGWPAVLTVDVNGAHGPNRGGRDIWQMSIFHDGSIDSAGLTPECRKDISKCWSPDLGSHGHSIKEINDLRLEHCKEFGYDGGGCFGHFKDNNFKFDY